MAVMGGNVSSAIEQEFFNQREAAIFLGIHENYMMVLAKQSDGPPRIQLGQRAIRYRRSDLIAWMEARKEGRR